MLPTGRACAVPAPAAVCRVFKVGSSDGMLGVWCRATRRPHVPACSVQRLMHACMHTPGPNCPTAVRAVQAACRQNGGPQTHSRHCKSCECPLLLSLLSPPPCAAAYAAQQPSPQPDPTSPPGAEAPPAGPVDPCMRARPACMPQIPGIQPAHRRAACLALDGKPAAPEHESQPPGR